jgi:hypothetical protein
MSCSSASVSEAQLEGPINIGSVIPMRPIVIRIIPSARRMLNHLASQTLSLAVEFHTKTLLPQERAAANWLGRRLIIERYSLIAFAVARWFVTLKTPGTEFACAYAI